MLDIEKLKHKIKKVGFKTRFSIFHSDRLRRYFSVFKNRFERLSRVKKIVVLVLTGLIFLSGSILVIAELGGYGVNGPATATNSLDYGLAGYWNFEEGSGQAVKDKSANGNNGTLGYDTSVESNDPIFSPGHDSTGENGTGITLDGINDLVDIDINQGFSSPTGISVGGWVRLSVDSSALKTGGWNYYSRGYGATLPFEFGHWGNGNPTLKAYNVAGSSFSLSSGEPMSGNTWYHIFATVDASTGAMKFYVNGILKNSNTSFSGTVPAITSMMIGGGSSGCSLPGVIDEFRIYNRALSEDEIRLLYNQKKPILHLKMEEGAGTALYDDSFNNRDGKIYNKINTAASATANTLADNDVNWTVNYWAGQQVSIIYGTGVGQTRTISSNTNNTLTVSQNWTVTPDTSSRYAMTVPGNNWTERNSNPAANLNDIGYIGFAAPDNAPISGTMPFTLEAWVKTTSASVQYVAQQRDLSGVTGEYVLEINGGKARYWDYAGSIAHNLYSSQTVNDGVWHHIVFTRNGRIGTIYVDGVVGGTSDVTAVSISSALDFAVGCDFRDAQGYFNGALDDVRVYSYARTADEVKADYDEGLAADLGKNNQDLNKGLVGYWDMEEGQGQIVYDKSGNNNDCTLGATSSVGNDDPIFAAGHDATGINGTGMKFDGINDYLNCGNDSSLDITQAITTSVWFYTDKIPASYFGLVGERYTDSDGSYQLYLGGSNQIIWATALEPDTRIRTVGTKSFVGAWHNATSTFSLDEQLQKIYVDGVKIIEESRTVPLELSTQSLKIGGQSLSMATIDGYIDEVRIYNRALSDDEIRYLYNQKKPILQLKMDEGSGNKAYDESFDNNDGTLGDGTCLPGAGKCPAWNQGKFGGGLSFDGNDDYVDCGNSTSLQFRNDFTYTAWIYPKAFGGYQAIITHRRLASSGAVVGLWMSNDNLYVEINNDNRSSTLVGTVGPKLNVNTWHHVALTHDSSGNVNIWLNGVSYLLGTASGPYTNFDNSLMIGQHINAQYFTGYMDDVRIYNYARSTSEVLADYNDGQAAHLGKNNQDLNRGLVGWWDMEEGGGQILKDKSGSGNDGTLGGDSSVNSEDPVFIQGFGSSGAKGTALVFDGVNDYAEVDAGASSSLNITNAITLCAWIKANTFKDNSYEGIIHKVNYSDPSQGTAYGLNIDWNRAGIRFFASTTDGYGKNMGSTANINAGIWYFVAGTYDSSTNTTKIYINGTLDSSSTSSITGAILPVSTNLKIGRGAQGPIDGIVDDARVYNRALSDDEIRMLYNQKRPVLQLKMEEGSGASAKDESFNNNDGTFGDGTCQPGAGTCPSWVRGKFGTALSFDGGDDYLNIPNSSSVSISKYITVEAWVRYSGYATQWCPIVWKDGSYVLDLWQNGVSPHFGLAGSEVISPVPLQTGAWTHLAGTYDGANIRLYINGAQIGSAARTASITTNSNPIRLGAVSTWRYNGLIDDVRIYNYARSASEVLTDYNDGQAAHLR